MCYPSVEPFETEPREPADPKVGRSAPRFATKFAATVTVDRHAIAVEIVDLSCVGACVQGHALPQRGEEIVLRANDLEVVGTVVWSDASACGINFHKPIAPLAVVASNLGLPNLNTFTKALAMRG